MKKSMPAVILLLLIVAGCNREKKDWNETKKINTTETYDQFMKDHPKSGYIDSAKICLDKILPTTVKISRCEIKTADKGNCEISFTVFMEHKVDSFKTESDSKVWILLFMTEKIYGGQAIVSNISNPTIHSTIIDCKFTPLNMTNCFGVMNMNVSVSDKNNNTLDKADIIVDFK